MGNLQIVRAASKRIEELGKHLAQQAHRYGLSGDPSKVNDEVPQYLSIEDAINITSINDITIEDFVYADADDANTVGPTFIGSKRNAFLPIGYSSEPVIDDSVITSATWQCVCYNEFYNCLLMPEDFDSYNAYLHTAKVYRNGSASTTYHNGKLSYALMPSGDGIDCALFYETGDALDDPAFSNTQSITARFLQNQELTKKYCTTAYGANAYQSPLYANSGIMGMLATELPNKSFAFISSDKSGNPVIRLYGRFEGVVGSYDIPLDYRYLDITEGLDGEVVEFGITTSITASGQYCLSVFGWATNDFIDITVKPIVKYKSIILNDNAIVGADAHNEYTAMSVSHAPLGVDTVYTQAVNADIDIDTNTSNNRVGILRGYRCNTTNTSTHLLDVALSNGTGLCIRKDTMEDSIVIWTRMNSVDSLLSQGSSMSFDGPKITQSILNGDNGVIGTIFSGSVDTEGSQDLHYFEMVPNYVN